VSASNPHETFLRQAIALGIRKMNEGCGGPFGALVVREGTIVGEGWNAVTTTNDPTAHAEIAAIRDACRRLQAFQLADCDVYCSCEPCPMCLGALYWARPRSVYFASGREAAARAGFDDAFIYAEIGKPFGQRSLPLQQLIAAEGDRAFAEWARKPDKTPY
jgi:tRNA(Arg) A34 adenosine deaminase TadA